MKKMTLFLVVSLLVLAACNTGAPASTPETEFVDIPPATGDFAIVAEGKVCPIQDSALWFATDGRVAEVLAADGALVAKGEVIARLEQDESLAAEVAQAELELLNAQQAVAELNANAALVAAQVQLEVVQAQDELKAANRRLSNLTSTDVSYYQEQVEKAEQALLAAQQNAAITDIGEASAALKVARDAVKDAAKYLDETQAAETSCGNCNPDRLKQAQDAYNGAVNNVKVLEMRLSQAQAANATAVEDKQKALDQAQANLSGTLNGPDDLKLAMTEAEVAMAEARLADAQSRYDKVKAGPDPDQLAMAQARVTATETALAAAKAAVKHLELRAPFAGAIADLQIKVGDQVTAGQIVATLADFSTWMVETSNLTEIEVVKISEGQSATVKLDALPDELLVGKVTSISQVFEEKGGDVTYAIVLALDKAHPLMRWGMTAEVLFEK